MCIYTSTPKCNIFFCSRFGFRICVRFGSLWFFCSVFWFLCVSHLHAQTHSHTITSASSTSWWIDLFPLRHSYSKLSWILTGNLQMFPSSSVLQQRHLKYSQRHIPWMTFSGDAAASPHKVFIHPRWPAQRVKDFATPVRYLKFKISPEIWHMQQNPNIRPLLELLENNPKCFNLWPSQETQCVVEGGFLV